MSARAPVEIRFQARHGCTLVGIRSGAYPALPDEVQLVWELRPG